MVGTLSFMSPETFKSSETTKQSDVYSLSLIFWQMMSGEYPFSTFSTPMQIVYRVVNDGLRPQCGEKWPQEFKDLLGRMWDNDPNKRPTTAQVAETIEEEWRKLASGIEPQSSNDQT